MLTCSIGKVTSVILRKSLSGLTFVEFNVPMDSYADTPTFDLTIDSLKTAYTVTGCDVRMQDDGKVIAHITGMPKSQMKWLSIHPTSVESMEVAKMLKSMGIDNGPRITTSLVNLFMTDGQLAIVLANMSPQMAFVNFGENRVEYYSELYKTKPLQVKCIFHRLVTRTPMAGYIGWDTSVGGNYPEDAQTILPFGQYTNMDSTALSNLVNNCNSLSGIFSDMQSFTAMHTFELGNTVVSNLTYDKKVIVGAEEHYDVNDCVTAIYYCV